MSAIFFLLAQTTVTPETLREGGAWVLLVGAGVVIRYLHNARESDRKTHRADIAAEVAKREQLQAEAIASMAETIREAKSRETDLLKMISEAKGEHPDS